MTELDLSLLYMINGSHSLFLDSIMTTLTSGLTWIPLYISLIYLVIKNNETMMQIVMLIGCAALCVAITSGVTELIVKPLVGRDRPSLDPLIKYTIDVVDGRRGVGYSFFSSHAANTFGIALFMSLVVRDRLFTVAMILWSLINCYTRMYLGLHYPGDILVGLLFGAFVGLLAYFLYMKLYFKVSPRLNYVSSQYTSTGYSLEDIDIVMSVLVLTLVYTVIRAVI